MLCRATTRRGAIAKNVSSAEDEIVEDSVGDRRAGGCAASRVKANFVRGDRNPRSSKRPDCRSHFEYRLALPNFGSRRGA
jgi:hypothetical protein